MLPDFVSIKRDLLGQISHAIQSRASNTPMLSSLPTYRQYEENRAVVMREDGSSQEITFDKPVTAEVEVALSDVRLEGPAASLRAIHRAGDALAEGMSKRMLESISDAVESVGNVVKGDGQPFTLDFYADALDKMELSFDEAGEWMPPTLILHPAMAEQARSALEGGGANSPVSRRIDDIINRQREEHRAREARRTLVD